MATIDREITELLHRLPELQQQRVLEFARVSSRTSRQSINSQRRIVSSEHNALRMSDTIAL